MMKWKVIFVIDGDVYVVKMIEYVVEKIGGWCIF